MIISGIQTGNTGWLGSHLQNGADNEEVELVEITGTVATDIDGALAEFDAIAAGTRATESVYALFINPPEPLTRLQYARAILLIEERLGLAGQPRLVLFHRKRGREHCHVVWSRIDLQSMRAIQLSFDRQKLRRCAQDLAAAFGLSLPPGLAQDHGAERFNKPPGPTRAEKAMQQRSGLSRAERRRLVTECYRITDSPAAFAGALEAAGFMLARGDKRCFVIIDTAGDVHSLARQIDGAKTKDVKKKLEGLPLSGLPPAASAKALMRQRRAAQIDAARKDDEEQRQAETRLAKLEAAQLKRRQELDLLWQRMKIRQMHERKVLLAHLKALEQKRIARRHWLAVGLAACLKKIAVIRHLLEYYEKKRRRSLLEFYRAMIDALRKRHDNEQKEIQRRYAAIERLYFKELQTFLWRLPATIELSGDNGPHHWTYSGGKFWRSLPVTNDDLRFLPNGEADVSGAVRLQIHAEYVINANDITLRHNTGAAFSSSPAADPEIPFAASGWIFTNNANDITRPPGPLVNASDDDRSTNAKLYSTGTHHF